MSDYEPRVKIKELEEQMAKITQLREEVAHAVGVKQDKPEAGVKHDSGKADLSILPRRGLEQAAFALMFGAIKYGKNNYKKGMEISRPLAAAMRHITAYLDKEELDDESRLGHLGHAAASVLMAIEMIELGTAKDDR